MLLGTSNLRAVDCGRRITTDTDAAACVKEIFRQGEAVEAALKAHEAEHFGDMRNCKSGLKGKSFFSAVSFAAEVDHIHVGSCTLGEKGNYECSVRGPTGCYVKRVKRKSTALPKPGQKSKASRTIDTTVAMETTEAKVVIVPDDGALQTAYPYVPG